jgi:signal transduction histidine kinase
VATFEAALAAGAPVVRLFGNVGWGESATPDADLLSYEAPLTEIAERFPSVILCLHEVRSLTGLILRHGVLGTHSQTLEETRILGNPYFVPLDRFLEGLGAITADLSERQREREERQRAETALQRSYQELRALSARLRSVREEESARIAREVHDGVGQLLTALAMDVSWLEKKLETCPTTLREELAGKLRDMSQLLDTAGEAVQRIVTELRPVVLDELGLEAAVEWYLAEFQQRMGIAWRLRSRLGETDLDPERSTALFRILQEALTNVARHAEATAVDIRLAAKEDRIILAVTDNGRGIPADKIADSQSLGLLGMRERARALGGDVVVRANPGGGTAVEASLPT